MIALPTPRAKSAKVPAAHKTSTPDDEPLIERFVKFRKAKGWTQDAAAARMEMSVNSLKAYERKSRTPNGPATLKLLTLMGALK